MNAHRSRSRGEKGRITLAGLLAAVVLGSIFVMLVSALPGGSTPVQAVGEVCGPEGQGGNWDDKIPPEGGGDDDVTGDVWVITDANPIDAICIKAGSDWNDDDADPNNDGYLGPITSDGQYECYDVDGMGTTTVTLTRLQTGSDCAGFSHVEVWYGEVEPNVGVEKTNNTEGTVAVGGSFNWIITVTVSNGPTTAVATITDTIPTAFTAGAPVAADPPFDCSATVGNSISCTLDSGTVNGSYIITVPVTAPDGDPDTECTEYNNTANVSGGGGTNTPSSDSDSVTVTDCEDPNVGIAKTNDTEGTVAVGGSFNWIITVTVSNGPTTAVATITDTIPTAFLAGAPVAADPPFDCSATVNNSISCTLDSGTANGSYTVTVPVTAPDGTPTSECTEYNNTANVTGGGGTNTPSSDSDSVDVTGCTTELDLDSSASASVIDLGESVSDTAFLSGNQGPVEGTVTFFVCGPENSEPDCSTGGTQVSIETLEEADNGQVTSDPFTPDEPGFYCFRFEFSPAVESEYDPASHTNQTTECFEVVEDEEPPPDDDEEPEEPSDPGTPQATNEQFPQPGGIFIPPAPVAEVAGVQLPARLPATGSGPMDGAADMTFRLAGLAMALLGLSGLVALKARRES
jgi:hypothetical protein